MNESNSPKQRFLVLQIMHFALTMGQVMFAGVVLFLLSDGLSQSEGETDIVFTGVALAVLAGGLAASHFLSNWHIGNMPKEASLLSKIAHYQTAQLIKFALMEGPGLLCTVFLLLTGAYFFLMLSGAIIVLFVLFRPTISRMINDLELEKEEVEQLR